jgi:hypothetical protein
MSTSFKLPPVAEAEERIEQVLMAAVGPLAPADHPLLQDWLAIKFALQELAAKKQASAGCTDIRREGGR